MLRMGPAVMQNTMLIPDFYITLIAAYHYTLDPNDFETINPKFGIYNPPKETLNLYITIVNVRLDVYAIRPHKPLGLPLCIFGSVYHNDDACHSQQHLHYSVCHGKN